MKKIFFSALVATVAIGAAFSTNASSKLAPVQGYRFNGSAPCSVPKITCNVPGPNPCTYQDVPGGPILQAYGQSTASTCTIPLNRQ